MCDKCKAANEGLPDDVKAVLEDGGVACEVGFEDIPDSNGVLYKFQYRSKDSLVAMVTVALDPTQPEAAQVMASIAEGDFSGLFRMAIERHTEIMDETIRNKASQN